jgi:hypothetical protein
MMVAYLMVVIAFILLEPMGPWQSAGHIPRSPQGSFGLRRLCDLWRLLAKSHIPRSCGESVTCGCELRKIVITYRYGSCLRHSGKGGPAFNQRIKIRCYKMGRAPAFAGRQVRLWSMQEYNFITSYSTSPSS